MITKKVNKKLLLSETEYAIIRELFFYGENVTFSDHVNYYFDTSQQDFHRKGITCQIRQKNGSLKGTIETYLRDQKDVSTEESFAVETLPYRFAVSSQTVYLQGSLYTRRLAVEIMPEIRMMLDQNWYLGNVDFQLEIEYSPIYLAQAEGAFGAIAHLLQHTVEAKDLLSKSHRFYLRKNDLPDETAHQND